jgi:hypothetical protein
MRLPAPLLEHPVEAAIAGLLLMALLFISADPDPVAAPALGGGTAVAQKM